LSRGALVFDTRYFVHLFYSKDPAKLKQLKKLAQHSAPKWISAITLMEMYKISVEVDGREAAERRGELMKRDFKVKAVDADVATSAASLQAAYGLSEGQAVIAATALALDAACVTDDPDLKGIAKLKTVWAAGPHKES
jgi:predicted nucleic acid-binding protein